MKKLLLSISVIILFAFYSLFQKKTSLKANTISDLGNSTTSNSNLLLPTSLPNSSSSTTSSSKELYKDGIYTGTVADAFYGNVQVQTRIQLGKITDITFLQYPNDRNHSIEINTYAMPRLKQEAILVQSANVDIVSGATATSQAFIVSLASTLAQVK
jgi:uncharacterized protein with FMN-binding domain